MGVIKTALEIALEKTEKVTGDKSSIDQFEARRRGKKLANSFLAGEENITASMLAEEIKKTPADGRESLQASLKQGIFDVLITQISLPARKEDESKIEKLGKGFAVIIKTGEFSAMYKQLTSLFSQYLQEAAQYEQMIRQQYAPKLRKKEEELSRRMGREVRIDPFQDPEFLNFYNQHMNTLRKNYESVVEQAREETRRMFEQQEAGKK